jgi:3-deoxy-manno-octulosonate cytidylyltransferase (CMP-KDO synthetase)
MSERCVAVIPARYGSSRFPGKPLALIAGKPMIQWCYESTRACPDFAEVIVATDDERICAAVSTFGGKAVMTASSHQTGTDRIAEAVADVDAELIVNVQGDEPLMSARVLSQLVALMRQSSAEMGTAAVPFTATERDPSDVNAVKVVLDRRGYALYFSRSLIPYPRQGGTAVTPLLHWGLYAYRRDFLYDFVRWERGRLEDCEMLEQLRALENGARILVLQTTERSVGVDTPADLAEVEKMLQERQQQMGR